MVSVVRRDFMKLIAIAAALLTVTGGSNYQGGTLVKKERLTLP